MPGSEASSRSTDNSESAWQRFLKGKTSPQLLLIALGALAAALLAIGAVVIAVVRFFDGGDDAGVGPANGEIQRIENQSVEADEFVRFLIDHDGEPVQLDHQVIAQPGPADVSLQYNCDQPTGCNLVRLQAIDAGAAEIAGGLWFQGCYGIVKDGAGYGAQQLDLELHPQGETCPT